MFDSRHRRFAAAMLAALLTSCASPDRPALETVAPTRVTESMVGDPWASLVRPLRLPPVTVGDECPVTESLESYPNLGPVLGVGPIYSAFIPADGVVTLTTPTPHSGRDWYVKKVLWLSDETYDGPAIIRAARVDGQGDVYFGAAPVQGYDQDWVSTLRLPIDGWVDGGAPSGWREWNTGSAFAEPGCYAYQIDGQSFTEIIVIDIRIDESSS
jgi:hypothetical protein